MATSDNKSGLLSKVARFVRNPTKDWSELDQPEPPPESAFNKTALKEMIERKRQNDFVRRREFDNLRKLRRNGPSAGHDFADRPSFFQSSIPSNPDERATTLKKIDEIEAQMSKQWWKSKQDEPSVPASNFPVAATVAPGDEETVPHSLGPREGVSAFASTLAPGLHLDAPQQNDGSLEHVLANAPTQVMPLQGPVSKFPDSGISGFSSSKLFSVEMGDGLGDPDLEEAAIRFANGDVTGAEAGLLAALQTDRPNAGAADGWAAALFDLYRATGQEASFDSLAIDYAQRFGRSAPAWFSTPELLGKTDTSPAFDAGASRGSGGATAWDCPEDLDVTDVQRLEGFFRNEHEPLRLQWSRLASITPEGGQALAALFARWCVQPVTLYFRGAEVLERTLRSLTPSGDKGVALFWWQLRLDALRLLRMQDEFELAALDYCVVYEVSPPPWEHPLCVCVQEHASAAMPLEEPAKPSESLHSGLPGEWNQASTQPVRLDVDSAAVVELTGEILGDAAEALDKLQAGLMGSDRLVISCARLIRVDFSAAGSILNWVANRETQGCHVQFRDVPRLVAAFFNVIGINEHARVVLRTS